MTHYNQSTIGKIFSEAENVFYRILEQYYNSSAKAVGGYLSLYQEINPESIELIQKCYFGSWNYSTKDNETISGIVCNSIVKVPGAITSGEVMGVRGAIKLNNSLYLCFMGLPTDLNEALVIATAMALKLELAKNNAVTDDGPLITLEEFMERSNNLILSDENFKKLMGY